MVVSTRLARARPIPIFECSHERGVSAARTGVTYDACTCIYDIRCTSVEIVVEEAGAIIVIVRATATGAAPVVVAVGERFTFRVAVLVEVAVCVLVVVAGAVKVAVAVAGAVKVARAATQPNQHYSTFSVEPSFATPYVRAARRQSQGLK